MGAVARSTKRIGAVLAVAILVSIHAGPASARRSGISDAVFESTVEEVLRMDQA